MNGGKNDVTRENDPPAGSGKAFVSKGYISAWFLSPSPRAMFVFRVGCVFLFFGMHNLLQVKIEPVFLYFKKISYFYFSTLIYGLHDCDLYIYLLEFLERWEVSMDKKSTGAP